MQRMKSRLFFLVIVIALTIMTLSACNLRAQQDKTISTTQTAYSVLFTQIAGTPTVTLPPVTPSPTVTLTLAVPPTPIPPTPGPRPTSYTLQPGEFPYCIARRFNVDPTDLLRLNNLSSQIVYEAGLTLTIPQNGHPFPARRSIIPHPSQYTVPEQQMSVYKIACLFGDVDPLEIVRVNNLTSYYVNYGVILNIP